MRITYYINYKSSIAKSYFFYFNFVGNERIINIEVDRGAYLLD